MSQHLKMAQLKNEKRFAIGLIVIRAKNDTFGQSVVDTPALGPNLRGFMRGPCNLQIWVP